MDKNEFAVVETASGYVVTGRVIASSEWDFIEKYLPGYSWDRDVTLSNDLAVVLEVAANGNPYEYMEIPESERDYSDAPFRHVMGYVDDLTDVIALEALLSKVDAELFNRALEAYKESKKR